MKYLVTGGAGFIGSNLIDELLKSNNEIIVLDNLSTGSMENVAHFKDKIKFIKASAGQVLEFPGLNGLDGIYHLGIPSTTMLYRDNRFLVGGAINEFIAILELARRENCKIVWASSSSVYNGNKPPFTEDMPVLIKDFYTEARYAMERLAKLYYDFYSVKSIGFRFFSVYGLREEAKKDFANLVSQFLWAMKKGESPLIYGDGSQTRDFTYAGDIAAGFIAGMASGIDCDIFNLGTSRHYSLNELVDILNKELKTNIKPVYQQNPLKNYVQDTLADVSKVERSLGWSAKIPLSQGIKKIMERN